MSIKRSKTSALLFATVFTGFLCLFQVACQFGSNTDKDNQEPSIDPDKFGLEDPSDRSNYQKNFVEVKIIPGSPTMNVKDFFVTATIAENNGIVRGAVSKKKWHRV